MEARTAEALLNLMCRCDCASVDVQEDSVRFSDVNQGSCQQEIKRDTGLCFMLSVAAHCNLDMQTVRLSVAASRHKRQRNMSTYHARGLRL